MGTPGLERRPRAPCYRSLSRRSTNMCSDHPFRHIRSGRRPARGHTAWTCSIAIAVARASLDYRIVADLAVSQPTFPPRRPAVTVHPVVIPGGPASDQTPGWELTLVNTSSVYVQAQVFRQHLSTVCQTHPGMRSQWIRASDGGIVLRFSLLEDRLPGQSRIAREIPMPQDLPPGGRLKLTVPADRLPASWANLPLKIEPSFTGVGQAEAPAETRRPQDLDRSTLDRRRPDAPSGRGAPALKEFLRRLTRPATCLVRVSRCSRSSGR